MKNTTIITASLVVTLPLAAFAAGSQANTERNRISQISGQNGVQMAQSRTASSPEGPDCANCHEGEISPPAKGSISRDQGLEAWARIFEVASHPRCANCHVGDDHRPMWSGPSYGKTRPHGMNIHGGESRIGAETIQCSTCHTTQNTPIAHGAPGNDVWHLPPVEMQWFAKTSAEICAQLGNPDTNGDRTFFDLARHVGHDELVHWGWKPGIGREPAPYSIGEHANDILLWGAAGMPCPVN